MRSLPKAFAVVVVVSIGLSGCAMSRSAQLAKSSLPRDTRPELPGGTVASLVGDNNAFALDLYRSLRKDDGNLVFSPYSISLALAMTYAGARGETASQMAGALHYSLQPALLHPAFDQLDLALAPSSTPAAEAGQPLQLSIANAVWAEQTLAIFQAYLDLIAQNYGASIRLADFINHSEAARQQINDWVSRETENKIRDLIAPGVLDSTTRLVLVNAIYFKGDWQDPFDPNDTRQAPFTLLDASQATVKMMSSHMASALYAAGTGYRAVELPYQGGAAGMDIIVPDEGTFKAFESSLGAGELDQIVKAMQPTGLALRLPKFKFGSAFELGNRLSALGMPDAFNPDLADFSGMTGARDLFISKVLHQASVAVDEKGTEAAAATSVIMAPTSALRSPVTMTIDHPFLFFIRDLTSGQILFAGRVLDPTR
jgi:serpin B